MDHTGVIARVGSARHDGIVRDDMYRGATLKSDAGEAREGGEDAGRLARFGDAAEATVNTQQISSLDNGVASSAQNGRDTAHFGQHVTTVSELLTDEQPGRSW